MTCKVTWCNNETEYYNKSQKYIYCPTHIQYKKYASNAPKRPHLMYKVEKVINNELQCENCGYNALNFILIYLKTNSRIMAHFFYYFFYKLEGEQPSNINCYVNNVIY